MTDSVKVGGEIEAQCGRCHDATVHKILVVEKGKAKRVQCTVCDAPHLYRRPKGPEEPRSRKGARRKTQVDAGEAALAAFEKAMKAVGPGDPVAYKPSEHFTEGQRLKHKSFGEGVVVGVPRPRVAQVIFKDGVRLLAMDR